MEPLLHAPTSETCFEVDERIVEVLNSRATLEYPFFIDRCAQDDDNELIL